MVDIELLLDSFLRVLEERFGKRVWFVGLQGSYARGEATPISDVDLVVILDVLSARDIETYNEMLDTLPYRQKLCGFLSGKKELLNWESSDLFQFYYDTKPVRGSLEELRPLIDDAAVDRAIKIGVCNIFHGAVHNMLYEKSEAVLKDLYKSASFVVQAICFRKTGQYISCRSELRQAVSPEERVVIDEYLHIKNGQDINFTKLSEILVGWTQRWITRSP